MGFTVPMEKIMAVGNTRSFSRARLAAIVASLLSVGVVGALALPALASTKSVKVSDNYFVNSANTATVTVKKNSTVKWNFVGFLKHDVTVVSGPTSFRSGRKLSGSYSKKVTRTGTYKIVCTIHPGMKMSLKVVG